MAAPKHKDFNDWWDKNHRWDAGLMKEIALDAWDAAVQGTWAVADERMPKSKVGKILLEFILVGEGSSEVKTFVRAGVIAPLVYFVFLLLVVVLHF